jgi:hydrogenase maturation protease
MGKQPDRTGRILVLGLGNDILSDDGVGLAAGRRVAALVGDEADFTEAGVATIDLLELMSGYRRVIIVDAFTSAELTPGTAVRTTPDDLPAGFGYRSFHTLTFREVLDIGGWLGVPLPSDVVIHGLSVEETTTFREGFSPRVGAAWESWAAEIARREFGVEPSEGGSKTGTQESFGPGEPRMPVIP